MQGPSIATVLVVLLMGMAPPLAEKGAADAIAEARRKLASDDGMAAVSILEDAIPKAGSSKDAVLDLLQQAYEAAEKQADRAGRSREAETYRENRKILNRKPKPPRTAPNPDPTPTPTDPGPLRPDPLPEGPTAPPTPAEVPVPPSTASDEAPVVEALPVPKTAPFSPKPAPGPDLATADAAFAAKDYRTAGRIYADLSRGRQLPVDRRDHWLYCRATEVAAQINAGPKSPADWAQVQAEIEQIRALNPNIYLGEYLRDLAAERQSSRKKGRPSNALVVRGSAPEEPSTVDRPVRPASVAASPPASRPVAAAAPNAKNWQVVDSANFRVYHADPALAARVVRAAEAARSEQARRWTGNPGSLPTWTPPCEVYLYPNPQQYAQMTGQPEDSPGFSTMEMNAGRIISRRISLRADHPTLVSAVLPHEVTHVILADFFKEKQIPRWADEGLAVLAEPLDEQQRRAKDLVTPLASNRLFPVDALMNMNYPEAQYWALYYAQSVSLTRFLAEQGTPAQMLQFLQAAQREGYEAGLRRVYQIEGFADLQTRWLDYARTQAEPQTATGPAPEVKVR